MYDFVFFTNLPAAYKVNLFDRLASSCRVKVFYVAPSSVIRSADFYQMGAGFDYEFLQLEPYEYRCRCLVLINAIRARLRVKGKFYVLSGWESPELSLLALFGPKSTNALVVESGRESDTKGIKGFLKRTYAKCFSLALPSGKAQADLLYRLGFPGRLLTTGGVGLIRASDFLVDDLSEDGLDKPYVFIGRLAPEKSVDTMFPAFDKPFKRRLFVLGDGPLRAELDAASPDNVKFLGHIPNNELGRFLRSAKALILPSRSEPWGLVVEEAISLGVPVIVRDSVGCAHELVGATGAGVIYQEGEIMRALQIFEEDEMRFRHNAQRFSLEDRANMQCNAYLGLLED